MLTLTQIIEMIRSQGKPCWKLGIKSGYQNSPVHSYLVGEPEIEESIRTLQHQVQFFKSVPNTIFSIVLYKTQKSSGDGQSGPFEFVDQDVAVNGLGGLGNPSAPQYPANFMQGLGELMPKVFMEDRLGLERERTLLLLEKNNLENDRKRFEEEKKRYEAEIKSLKEKYESHSTKVSNGVVMGLEKVLDQFGKKEDNPLSGVTVKTQSTEDPDTEQFRIVSDFAEHLHSELTEVKDLKYFDKVGRRIIIKLKEGADHVISE